MQLPRGTFHSIKKGLELETILRDLKEERFSGSCSLACGSHAGNLVFQDGQIMLASFDSSCGDAAMEIIFRQMDSIADASMSDLTAAQLKLTLEFNEKCRVSRERSDAKKIPATPQKDRVYSREKDKAPITPERLKTEGSWKISESPVQEKPIHTVPPSEPAGERGAKSGDLFASDGEESTMVDRDLQALDAMDLDTMRNKIRMNCKLMIEKLHLEHLIDDKGT